MNKERLSNKEKSSTNLQTKEVNEKIAKLLLDKTIPEKYSYLNAISQKGCQINFKNYR